MGCASTGNAGISLAAYSFALGIECHVWIGGSARSEKVALIEAFGAVIHVVAGGYDVAYEQSHVEMERLGIYNANPGICSCRVDANREIGKELAELAPDLVVCPLNNGIHFKGVVLGLLEMGARPRMVAATASASRIADSIATGTRLEGSLQNLGCPIEEVDVNDLEIAIAVRELMMEGIVAEPAAACGVATLRRLALDGEGLVCVTVTGFGLRYPSAIGETVKILRTRG